MKTSEQLFDSIKSSLLDLLLDLLQDLEYEEFINRLEKLFLDHFDVSKIELFLYVDNQFQHASTCLKANKHKERTIYESPLQYTMPDILLEKKEPHEFRNDTFIICNEKSEPIAMMFVKSTEAWQLFADTGYFEDFQVLLGRLVEILKNSSILKTNTNYYHYLLEATKQFNSTLETQKIYEQLVKTVTEIFASLSVSLIVSQEELNTSCPYRLFDYSNELPSTTEAFLTGELTIENREKEELKILNAPIKGKQGTYGILQLCASPNYVFTTIQKEFVQNISESAGYALENSSLYSQSHRLIRDLKLVNEVSKKLTGRLIRREMVAFINKTLIETFEHEEIAFVSSRGGERDLAIETSDYFYTPAGRRYLEYAELSIKKEWDALYIADLSDTDIGCFSSYRSMIIVPMIVADEFVGYTILLHKEKYKYSLDDFKLAKAIVSHSSLALSNLSLREKLQELVNKDQLTGLFARGYLDRYMSDSFKKGIGGAFLLLDIDDFKQINDKYGHAIGDLVLIQTAKVLQSSISDQDVAGRWGGEEFAIYLPEASLEAGKEVAERILQQMPVATNPSITVSIGVSVWNPLYNEETYQQLFQQTDEALYAAKSNGKKQIVVNETIRE